MSVPTLDAVQTITPSELDSRRQDGRRVDLVDVRAPAEFRELHAVGARNVPWYALDPRTLRQEGAAPAEPVYVICRVGKLSGKVAAKLTAGGISNVVSVAGGTLAWQDAGLPVVRGQKMVSLERQVRIAAGTLVLVSALLAMFVNPWFAALAAFIGGGLAFAGITDTCAMAMVLARMPWNQRGEDSVGVREVPACKL